MYRIFYPLIYFRLKNNTKRFLDFYPTALLALIIAVPFILIPDASFFGAAGFLGNLLSLTGVLTGFYVAALVAAATFDNKDLDAVIRSGPVILAARKRKGSREEDKFITRRELACIMFGYLSFISFLLSLFSVVVVAIASSHLDKAKIFIYTSSYIPHALAIGIRDIIILAVAIVVSHMAVVTGVGIYYLMERLYKNDPKIITKKPNKDAA